MLLKHLAEMLRLSAAARLVLNLLRFQAFPIGGHIHFLRRGKMLVAQDDNRATQLLKNAGILQPMLVYIWRKLIRILSPDIVLDIGANYGEFILSSAFPRHTRIYAFEPNPQVFPFLQRSIRSHKNAERILALNKAVSDGDGRLLFTIDQKWSGTSAAIGIIEEGTAKFKGNGPEIFQEVEVDTLVIDRFLQQQDPGPSSNVAFKIDVEGFECKVFCGMLELLARAESFAGILEFDQDNLLRAGTVPSDFLGLLGSQGFMFTINRDHGIVPIHDVSQLSRHCDLLLCSDRSMVSEITLPAFL